MVIEKLLRICFHLYLAMWRVCHSLVIWLLNRHANAIIIKPKVLETNTSHFLVFFQFQNSDIKMCCFYLWIKKLYFYFEQTRSQDEFSFSSSFFSLSLFSDWRGFSMPNCLKIMSFPVCPKKDKIGLKKKIELNDENNSVY